jgi:hypothetical protein
MTIHLIEVEQQGEWHVDRPMGRRVRLAQPLGQRRVDAREQSHGAERADLCVWCRMRKKSTSTSLRRTTSSDKDGKDRVHD